MRLRISPFSNCTLIGFVGHHCFGQLPSEKDRSDNKEGYQAYKEGRYSRSRDYFVAALWRAEQFDNGDLRLNSLALITLADFSRNRVKYSGASRCTYGAINSEESSLERRTELASI